MAKRREKGDGSIYQRESDKRYYAYARLENGKKKYVSDMTRSGVAKKLKALQKDIANGKIIAAKPESVEAFLLHWLIVHKQVRGNTRVSYRYCVRVAIRFIGEVKLQKLAGDHLQLFYDELEEEGYAASTINLFHTILSTAFKEAIKWKRLSSNPCADVTPPQKKKKEMQALTGGQCQELLARAKGHPLECFLTVALATGARKGELLALRWSDIDMESKSISIQRTACYLPDEEGHHRFVENDPKTKTSKRSITLAQFALDALKIHKIKQLKMRMANGANWNSKSLVFPNERGTHFDFTSLRMQFNKLLLQAELPHIRIHDLRHSAATLLLKMGVPAKVVQEILGHSSIVITMDIYGHVQPGMQDDAMQKMDKKLGSNS